MKVAEGLTTIEEVLRSTPSLDMRACSGPARPPSARAGMRLRGALRGNHTGAPDGASLESAAATRSPRRQRREDQEPEGLLVRADVRGRRAGLCLGRHQLQLRHFGAARARATFPFGLGVLLAVLGALVLFKALTIETEGGDPIGAIAWRPLI